MKGEGMDRSGLSPQDFQSIVRACRGVLINASVVPLDLKQFLAVNLSSSSPDLAARIVQFDDEEMNKLRQAILMALPQRTKSSYGKTMR
jgi:hypothetical protein